MSISFERARRVKRTIPAFTVGSDLTDFPIPLTHQNLPSEMFDADGSYPALEGGGDILVSTDVFGLNRVPIWVVRFNIDNNPANGRALIWVKLPAVYASSVTNFYVWYHKAGASQPPVTDSYGRNAVWSNGYRSVHGLEEAYDETFIDATGNGFDSTGNNLESDDSIDGVLGKSIDFEYDTVEEWLEANNAPDADGKLLTMECWAKLDDPPSPTWTGIVSKYNGSLFDYSVNYGVLSDQGFRGFIYYGSTLKLCPFGSESSYGVWHYIAVVSDGSNLNIYVDKAQGSPVDISTLGNIRDSASPKLFIGRYPHASNMVFPGAIDEVRISNVVRSKDWIDACMDSQGDPGNFVTGDSPVSTTIYDAPSTPLVTTYNSDLAETDGEANPDNLVTHKCKFSAVAKFSGVDKYQIQVGTSPGGDEHWDSSIVDFGTPPSEDQRCEKIQIAAKAVCGSWLQAGVSYYWRIRFFDSTGGASTWTSNQTFRGVTPAVWDDGSPDLSGTNKRRIIDFGSSHSLMPSGSTVRAEIETGYGVRLVKDARINEALQCSNRATYYHAGFKYTAYLAQKTTDGFLVVKIIKYKYADGSVSSYDVKTTNTQADSHDAPSIIVGDDEKIHLIVSGHNTQGYYFRTTNAHVPGIGIDITSWTSEAAPAALSACTYPRIRKDSKGNIFCFFRHRDSHSGNWCYMKSDDNGSTWGSRKYVAYYSDYLTTAPCMYCGGVEIDNQDRCHLILTFWEGYLSSNISRAVAYVYADLDGSDEFTDWYELDNAAKVGSSTAAAGSANIQFGDLTLGKGIVKLWDDDTPPYDGPYYHSNSDCLAVDEQNQLPVFCFFTYDTPNTLQVETPILVAYWNSVSKQWEIRNLEDDTGEKLWVHRQGGAIVLDGNQLNIYGFVKPPKDRNTIIEGTSTDTDPDIIDSGTCNYNASYNTIKDASKEWVDDEHIGRYGVLTSGADRAGQIEQITSNQETWLGVSPQIYNPRASLINYAIFETNPTTGKNTSIRVKDVKTKRDFNFGEPEKNWTPDNFAGKQFYIKAGDGLNRVRDITGNDWYSVTLGAALDVGTSDGTEYEIYEEATENLYSAGELYVWRGALINEPFTGEFLSANTGKGCGMITTDGKSNSVSGREIIINRLNEIVLIKDIKHPDFRVDGNDIVIVKASIDGSGNYSFVELDRVPDAFGMKGTNIFFALTGSIAADVPYEEDQTYLIYSGDSDTAHIPLKDHTNVWEYIEGFERYIHGTYLNGQGGWSLQSGGLTACTLIDTSNNQWGHTAKVWNGSLGAWFFGAAVLRKDFGSTRTDREINYAVHTEDIGHSGKVWINLIDGSGNGFSFGLSLAGGNGYAAYKHHDGSWTDTSVGVNGATWYMLTLKINSSGISGYLNKGDDPADRITCFTNDNHITDFRYLEIGAEGPSFAAMVDLITVQHAFADDPETAVYGFPDVQGLEVIVDLIGQPMSTIAKTIDPEVSFDFDAAIAATMLNLNLPDISVEKSPLQISIGPTVLDLNVLTVGATLGAISPAISPCVLNLNVPGVGVAVGAITAEIAVTLLDLAVSNIDIIKGAISPEAAITVLALNIPNITVDKGAISADLAAAVLNLNVNTVAVIKGYVSADINPVALGLSVPDVSITRGSISPAVAQTVLNLSVPGINAFVDIEASIAAAVINLNVSAVTVLEGAVVVDIAAAIINLNVPNIDVSFGSITCEIAATILNLNIPDVSIVSGLDVDVAPVILNLSGPGITVDLGGITSDISTSVINLNVPGVGVSIGALSAAVVPATMALNVPGISVDTTIQIDVAPVVLSLNSPVVSVNKGAISSDILFTVLSLDVPDIGASQGIKFVDVAPVLLNIKATYISVSKTLNVDVASIILSLDVPEIEVSAGPIIAATAPAGLNLQVPTITVSIAEQTIIVAPSLLNMAVPNLAVTLGVRDVTVKPAILQLQTPDVNIIVGQYIQLEPTILNLAIPEVRLAFDVFVDVEPVILNLIAPRISGGFKLEIVNIKIEPGLKFNDLVVSPGLFARNVKANHPMAFRNKSVAPLMRFKNIDIEETSVFEDLEVE